MDPPLREAMLVRGEVDVISGHYFSSMLDLQSKGVAEDDIVFMLYADLRHGLLRQRGDRLGRVHRGEPGGGRGLQRAVARGLKDVIADPRRRGRAGRRGTTR